MQVYNSANMFLCTNHFLEKVIVLLFEFLPK